MSADEQDCGERALSDSALGRAVAGLRELLIDSGGGAEEPHSGAVLRALLDHLPVLVYAKDSDGRFIMANDEVARVMGARSARDLIGRTDAEFYPPEQAAEFRKDDLRVVIEGISIVNKDEPRRGPAGTTRWIMTTKVPLRDSEGRIIGLVGVSKDITARKQIEEERDSYIAQLQEALANVRTLRGLLPICANCKHIRDDTGYWHRVEHYVQKHTHAEFSHGICPDCARKLYPDTTRRLAADVNEQPPDLRGPASGPPPGA